MIFLLATQGGEVINCMKNHKIKLIIVLSTLLLLSFTTLNVFTTYVKMKKTVEDAIANQSLEAATAIAATIDLETYQHFLVNEERDAYYWKISGHLNDIRKKMGVLAVYTLKIDNPKVAKIMVGGIPYELAFSFDIGEACTVPEAQVQEAYKGNTYVTGIIDDPKFGTYLSVGAPIKDEAGNIIGYLGIDIGAETLNGIIGKVLGNNILLFVFNVVFILVVIASFFFLQRWYQKEMAKEVEVTEDTYQAEIKTLLTSVSSLRHDYTNHIQVLYGLLQLGEAEQAKEYLASLSKEVLAIKTLKFNIEHPGLSILLQSKKLAAQNYNIDMNFSISSESFEKIKTTDLIIILSNLIDNAIDAAKELPEGEREISICIQSDEKDYIFKIINTGPTIVETEQIYVQGYSTKKVENGKIRGQGLFIVREIVNKYDGQISIYPSAEFETTALVKIPL